MNVYKAFQTVLSGTLAIIAPLESFNTKKNNSLNIKKFSEFQSELQQLWLLQFDESDDVRYRLKSKIKSLMRGNYEVDFSEVDELDIYATYMALKCLDKISLEVCNPNFESEKRYFQVKIESLMVQFRSGIYSETKGISTSRQLHNISITAKERAEVTFLNDILDITLNLIRLEPKLESEIMRFLFKLIPSPLYSYYLSQKGQFNVMKSLSPIERLREVCQNYLEMSTQSPPVIQRSLAVDQSVIEKLEQLINETKQAKRMTFKTAEEIKQVVLEASGVEEEVTTPSDDRDAFVQTVIELYDSMFHLVRMFKTNGNKELYEATSQELARMEVAIKEVDLEALKAVGEKIDPSYMQGVAVVPSADADGFDQYVVYDEIRKGFKDLKANRIIREAQVITVLN